MADKVKVLGECADKLIAEIYKLQRKHDPEKLVEYFTLTTSVINLVQFTERANLSVTLKKPADAQIADATEALNVAIKTLDVLGIPTNIYKDYYAKLSASQKNPTVKLGSSEKCYKCGQRSEQYEQEVELAKMYGMAEPPKPNLAEIYNLLKEDIYTAISRLSTYVAGTSTREEDTITVYIGSDDKTYVVELSEYESVIELLHILMDRVQERDMQNIVSHINSVSVEDKKMAVTELARIIPAHVDLSNERHVVKTKIMSILDTIKIPLGNTIRDQEKQMDMFASTLNEALSHINYLVSPDVKSTCILSCYEVADLLIIPLKLKEKKLTKLVEKKYGVYAPKSKREVEKFVKNYL